MIEREEILESLQNKELDILHVEKIYKEHRDDKEIVGQVAMNLSLRTSVYEREKGYSQTMVDLLSDIAVNPIDMGARWAVAKNPHAPAGVLETLSKDSINLVRALVATNPSTPSPILEKFFNDEKIVRDGLSGNPNTPIKLLKILVNDSDKMVRMRLAENPNVTKEILTQLLEDSDTNVILASQSALDKLS